MPVHLWLQDTEMGMVSGPDGPTCMRWLRMLGYSEQILFLQAARREKPQWRQINVTFLSA